MARLKWTPQALDDIDAICTFIARDSEYYAKLFANQIFEKAEYLQDFPQSGRIVPELNKPEIRELISGNYRIKYRINDEIIEILTVYHGARLIDESNFE